MSTSILPWRVSPRLIRPRPTADRIVPIRPSGNARKPAPMKNDPNAATDVPSATAATELPGSCHGAGPPWSSGSRSIAFGEIRQPGGGPGFGPGGTGGSQPSPAAPAGGSKPPLPASGRSGVSVSSS
jgi:hypothetical protein